MWLWKSRTEELPFQLQQLGLPKNGWVDPDVPSGYVKIAIEHDHFIVDFPIEHGDFPVRSVNIYQAGYFPWPWTVMDKAWFFLSQASHIPKNYASFTWGYDFAEPPVWTVSHPSSDTIDMIHEASLGVWGYRFQRHLQVGSLRWGMNQKIDFWWIAGIMSSQFKLDYISIL